MLWRQIQSKRSLRCIEQDWEGEVGYCLKCICCRHFETSSSLHLLFFHQRNAPSPQLWDVEDVVRQSWCSPLCPLPLSGALFSLHASLFCTIYSPYKGRVAWKGRVVRKRRLWMIIQVAVIIVMCASSGCWVERSHLCCRVAELAIDLLLI